MRRLVLVNVSCSCERIQEKIIFDLFDKCSFRWGSYLYFNAEIVNNGDKIKLRDALGNFLKSPAVQVIQLNNFLSHCTFDTLFSGIRKDLEAPLAADADQRVLEHLESTGTESLFSH